MNRQDAKTPRRKKLWPKANKRTTNLTNYTNGRCGGAPFKVHFELLLLFVRFVRFVVNLRATFDSASRKVSLLLGVLASWRFSSPRRSRLRAPLAAWGQTS